MKLMDYSKLCIEGISFFDGQYLPELKSCVSYGVIINEKLDRDKMDRSLRRLYAEIDCFHMRLSDKNEYVFDESISEGIHWMEAIGESGEERLNFAKRHLVQESAKTRDRYTESPFYVEIFEIEDERYFLAAYIDRYVADGHSVGLALMKLIGYYTDEIIPAGESKKSMREYIKETVSVVHEAKAEADALYWKEHLDGYVIAPYVRKSSAPAYEDKYFTLNVSKKELTEASRKLKVTLGNLLTAVYHLTLYDVFGAEDNVISYVSTDRKTLDDWGIIGPFVKPLNSRIKIDVATGGKQFLKEVSEESGQNLIHRDVHIEDIRVNRYLMMFLNHSRPFLTGEVYTQWMPDLCVDNIDADFIYLRMQELAEDVQIDFICNKNRICKKDYSELICSFEHNLKEICTDSDRTIGEITRREGDQ